MNKVYVIGYGLTTFGEHYEKDGAELATEAVNSAIDDNNIYKEEIDMAYFGTINSPADYMSSVQFHALKNCGLKIPSIRIEAGNASGAAAFKQAYYSVKGAATDLIVVIGVEKLSDFVKPEMMEEIAANTIDYQWEYEMGATVTSLYSLITQAHMEKHGTTMEELAAIPSKNHAHGVNNPNAQFRRALSADKFLNAKRIADPIGRFDLATPCDGAVAIILASQDYVEKNNIEKKVPVLASTQASDYLALHDRKRLDEFIATKIAADKAYKQAEIGPTKISFAEVHDSYPIGEILSLEDLGFFDKGQAAKAAINGITHIGGEKPINPSGGLKARGDPYGATGLAQIVEVVQQLQGKAEKRQIDDAKYGLAQNVYGTGAMTFVHILGKEEIR